MLSLNFLYSWWILGIISIFCVFATVTMLTMLNELIASFQFMFFSVPLFRCSFIYLYLVMKTMHVVTTVQFRANQSGVTQKKKVPA